MGDDSIRILFVEDNKTDRISLDRQIKREQLPFTLALASTVEEGRRFVKKEVFDIVLLDYSLKDGTAFELFSLVPDHIPVVVVTGSGNEKIAAQAVRLGAADYIIKDPDNNWLKIVPVTITNTVRNKRTEKALKESERQMIKMLESVQLATFKVDLHGKITFVNKYMLNLSSRTHGEIIDKYWPNVFVQAEKGGKERLFWKDETLLNTGHSQYEDNIITSKGENKLISWNNTLLKDLSGNPVGVAGIGADITAQRQVENRIKESLTEKEVLLREIHHRVKNNLSVISSLIRIQSRKAKDEEHREMFRDVHLRILSMAVVHEMLYKTDNLSEIQIDGYVEQLVQHVIQANNSSSNRITIGQEIEPIRLNLDLAVPLGFILVELISNALKHAFPGVMTGSLSISLWKIDDKEIEVAVADSGIGISQKIIRSGAQSLGYNLIDILVRQLNGTMDIHGSTGTRVSIRFKQK
jgi:PAS domain S-box-containing protein